MKNLIRQVKRCAIEHEESSMKTTYTVDEICQILRISKPTAYALVNSGVFSSIKFKNTIRISKESFDKWLEGETDTEMSNCR